MQILAPTESLVFKMGRVRPGLWLAMGLFLLLILSGPMAFATMLLFPSHRSTDFGVVTLVCLLSAWLNFAWVCRNLGLVRAKKTPELIITSDGLFMRTVRRSYRPPDLFRPTNVWQESTVAWDEIRSSEKIWVGARGSEELFAVKVILTTGTSLELREAVFGPQLEAIANAIAAGLLRPPGERSCSPSP